MARPRTTTDGEILEQARACFLEHGPAVSTAVIAARLGISHAVLFQRFGSKEQLMRAALMPPREPPWLARLRDGPDARDMRGQLAGLAEEIYVYLARIVPCVAVLRAAGIGPEAVAGRPDEHPAARARRELKAWFARAIERGLVRAVRPGHAADLLLGTLHFRPFHLHISGEGTGKADNRAYLEFTVDVVWRALTPPDAR
jgi:AcrR family transcriptional regulator